jgi:hypothetical protein
MGEPMMQGKLNLMALFAVFGADLSMTNELANALHHFATHSRRRKSRS